MRPLKFCCAILLLTAGPAMAGEPPVGEWLVADGSARIGIDNCDGALWGVVTWEKKPGTDTKNPDRSKRNLPTLHLPILLAMTPATDEDRWDGKVYNAENGKTYTAHISLSGADALRIEGCVFGGYLCGGETWQRVAPVETDPAKPPPQITPAPRPKSAKSSNPGGSQPRSANAPSTRPVTGAAPAAPAQSEVCAAVTDRAGPSH